ncbi:MULTISPECIES: hypothetical protein [unclassified Streptomyces]|uniref:hypothetical protein n=1 Tax=unclassified Streptomyces TaxID=2593676 RepID=UPI0027E4F54A|nr:hypothetical protein [Streptomyces sp. SM10]
MERFSAETEGLAQRLRDGMAGGAHSFPLAVGPVRAPLTDPGPADLAGLAKILDAGPDLVGAPRHRTA